MSALSWFAYASIVSTLLVCSAVFAERAAAALKRPRRWWWCAVVALSFVLPALEAIGWSWRNTIRVTPNELWITTS